MKTHIYSRLLKFTCNNCHLLLICYNITDFENGDKMKKNDIILIIVIAVVSGIAYLLMNTIVNNSGIEDGIAVVIFENEEILEIYLEDGTYKVLNASLGIVIDEDNNLFTIPDTNGEHDLVIEYSDNQVRVKEEVSPQNICSLQGWSNSPLKPITCIPNNLVIVIKTDELPPIDDIT